MINKIHAYWIYRLSALNIPFCRSYRYVFITQAWSHIFTNLKLNLHCDLVLFQFSSIQLSHSVVSDSLRPHGLCSPWNSPGQNTGVGSLSLLQQIFLTQESNRGLLHCRRFLCQLSYQGSPLLWYAVSFSCRMWLLSCSIWDLALWSRIKPEPPELGSWSLSPWTTREVTTGNFLNRLIAFKPDLFFQQHLASNFVWETVFRNLT